MKAGNNAYSSAIIRQIRFNEERSLKYTGIRYSESIYSKSANNTGMNYIA